MAKKRYNVSDIAELLIEEMEAFNKSAESIKKATDTLKNTKVEIAQKSLDTLKQIFNENKEREQAYLHQLSTVLSKNKARLPNWILTLVLGFFLSVIGFSIYTYKQLEKVSLLEVENEYLKADDTKGQ